ncbi:MAG: FG-GAP-like repeat-containing protein, partial [bacterium]
EAKQLKNKEAFEIISYETECHLFINNGDGTFTEETTERGLIKQNRFYGAIFLDYNNDGWFDLFTRRHNRESILYKNNKDGTFTVTTPGSGLNEVIPRAPYGGGLSAADFNNDGYIDILAITSEGKYFRLYRNNGDGTFTNVAENANILANTSFNYSAPVADYNQDGYLDIYLARCDHYPPKYYAALYENSGGTNHWLHVKLTGVESNKDAVGARVIIYTDGECQMRQVLGGDGYKMDSLPVEFGLGEKSVVDSMVIYWPSGTYQKEIILPSDTLITIEELEGVHQFCHIVSGVVDYYNNQDKVPSVGVKVTGTSSTTAYSDLTGTYHFIVSDGVNNIDITPSKQRDTDVGELTISAYDAGLTAQAAEGIQALYGISAEAGDVNDNNVIDENDPFLIAQKTVGLSNSDDSQAGDWKFDPSKIHIERNIDSNLKGQDFTAWISGDVDGSWSQSSGLKKKVVNTHPSSSFSQVSNNDSTISISLTLPDNLMMISADLWLEYDPSLFSVHDIKTTPLSDDFQLVYNDGVPGLVKIALYNAEPIGDQAEYLQIIFDIIPDAINDTTTMHWKYYRINNEEYEEDDIFLDLRTYSVSGKIQYYQNDLPVPEAKLFLNDGKNKESYTNSQGMYQFFGIKVGDNGIVTPSKETGQDISQLVISAYDAFLAARYSVNTESLTELQIEAADVDKNGSVEISDAESIAQASVGNSNTEPSYVGEWQFLPSSFSYTNITADIVKDFMAYALGDINGDWVPDSNPQSMQTKGYKQKNISESLAVTGDDEFSIPVNINEGDSIGSADLWMEYDETAIELTSITIMEGFKDFYLTYNTSTPGILKIAMFNTEYVKDTSDFINLNFRVISHEITNLHWKHFRINNKEYTKDDIGIDNRRRVYITISTEPRGLNFYANAVLYTAPHTFTWPEGSLHHLKVESPQSSDQGTRYVFSSWSDGAERIRNYQVPGTNDELTITFDRQYYLSMDTLYGNPQGQGWYDENQDASFSVTTPYVDSTTRFLFNHWEGDYSGTDPSGSIVMDSPKTITASWDTQYYLDISSPYGNPQGKGWYDAGAEASFSLTTPIQDELTKYIFDHWSGDYSGTGSSGSILMDDAKVIIAHWFVRHYLSISKQPNAGGDITPSPPGGWYAQEGTVELKASAAPGYTFTSWSGDLSSQDSSEKVTVVEPMSITANFKKRIQVVINTDPSGLDFTADSNSYTAPNTFIWLEDSEHQIDVDSIHSLDNSTRYRFNNWSNKADKNQLYIVPGSNSTLTAQFFTQYFLNVNSSYGDPQGEGWYNRDSTAIFFVDRYHYEDKTRLKFFRWSGDVQNDTSIVHSLIMDSPKTVTANWKTQHFLTVENSGHGIPKGQGWYDHGKEAEFSITPTLITMQGDSQYVFTGWSGKGIGSYSGEKKSHTITINNPVTETANWQLKYKITTSVVPAWAGSIQYDAESEWVNQGEQISVTAVPASGTDYEFSLWSGDISGDENPKNIMVNSPREICAHFILRGTTTVTTDPEGIPITVDDTTYVSPHQFNWISGTTHIISVPQSYSPLEGVKFTYHHWNNEGKRVQQIEAGVRQLYNAIFLIKYYLSTSVDPQGAGEVTPQSNWFDMDSIITVQVNPAAGFDFQTWSGDLNSSYNPDQIVMSSPKQITAEMKETTGIENADTQLLDFSLGQNQPNPFNPETNIEFTIPHNCYVELSVYNTKGQHIKTLLKGHRNKGIYSVIWDGTDELKKQVSSGVYFYILKTDSQLMKKKCILLR